MILLAVVGPLSLFVVRDWPRPEAVPRRLNPKGVYAGVIRGIGNTDRTFWLLTAAFYMALAATFAMLFHQVAYL